MRQLVERAIAGDREAYAELARTLICRLYAVAFLILRNQAQAEDAHAGGPRGGLGAISRRCATRTASTPGSTASPFAPAIARRGVAAGATARALISTRSSWSSLCRSLDLATRDELEREFSHLGADQRSILVLHFYLGLPLTEVAEVLGMPVGTAKSRMHRGGPNWPCAWSLEADARSPLLNKGGPVLNESPTPTSS